MPTGWVVDTREPPEIQEYFRRLGAKVSILEVGDFVFNDVVGFERKSSDFLGFDRMLSQTHELVRRYPSAFLLVEKNLDELIIEANRLHTPTALNHVMGVIASLCVRGTVPLFCSNQGILTMLAERIAKKATDSKDRDVITDLRTRQFSADSVALSILLGFPGLGIRRAQTVVEYYKGNVRAILNAILNNPDELAGLPGIGKTTVSNIRAVLDSKPEELVL